MVIVNSKKHANRTFRISTGEEIVCDINGNAAVSEEALELLNTKYAFKEFIVVEEGVEELGIKDQVDAANLIGNEDITLIKIINSYDKIDELKKVAKDLELPASEWRSRKDKDSFKKYLIESISE